MSLLGRTLADGDRLEVAGAVVRLKINRRARRVSLRLDRMRGEIVATAPSARRLAEAAAFAHDRAGWIAQRLAELPRGEGVTPGMTLPLFGEAVRLDLASGRARFVAATESDDALILAAGEGEAYVRAALRVIKAHALEVFTARTEHYAAALGAVPPTVAVMDARSRWGSCKAPVGGKPAAVRYSWRLALAPFAVADYVAAHECAHLLEMNHSPAFWSHVSRLVGDPRPHRAWLRAEGARLHAFGRA